MKCSPDTPYGILKTNNTLFLKKISEKLKIFYNCFTSFSIFGYLDKDR